MVFRKYLFALVALVFCVQFADAGPFRNRRGGGWSSSGYAQPQFVPVAVTAEDMEAKDGLDEVNARRAQVGLRPFKRDEGLAKAALACVKWRMARGINGHTGNDYMFVPDGSFAAATGAEGPGGNGYMWHMKGDPWNTCCKFEGWTYAGAASVCGSDGRRYMHLFVR